MSPTANTVSPLKANGAGFQAEISTGRGIARAMLALRRVVGADEITDAGQDLLTPFAAVEDAVVADPRLFPVHVARAGDVGRERVCGLGLADAGNIIELAFDRHQRGLDGRRIDLAPTAHPGAARQLVLLEHDLDGL